MKPSIFDFQHLYLKDYLFKIFPAGKLASKEFSIGDIQGNAGHSLMFNIEKGCGKDFATGEEYKNIVELVMAKFGLEEQAAFKKIEADWDVKQNIVPLKESKKKPQIKQVLFDRTASPSIPQGLINKYGEPSGKWLYENTEGQGIGWIVRFDPPNEKKQFYPFILGDDGLWHSQGFDKPRPLYNLSELVKTKNIILICEGEKAAEAARVLLPYLTVTTNVGGSQAIKESNWSALAGKKVLLWRDNDKASEKWQVTLANILSDLDCAVRVFKDDAFADRSDGWDAADLLATGEFDGHQLEQWVKHNITEYQRGGADSPASTVDGDKSAQIYEEPLNKHYRCLGLVGSSFALYNYHSGRVDIKTAEGFTEAYCRTLVCGATDYWKWLLKVPKEGKISWKSIAGVLANDFYKLGQFDMERVRGLGCWVDRERMIFNAGEFLYVEGRKIPINEFESDFVYTRGKEILPSMDNKLSRAKLTDLEKLCHMFSWEYPACGTLLAGWLMLAPICGALDWRPHIYITGMSGSGKSTIYSHVLMRTLKNCVIASMGDSTKAGIAQSVKTDSLPVIFDEIENDSKDDEMRNERILKMARFASTGEGKSLKGRSDQSGAESYVCHSSFCFSSISPSVKYYADFSRITLLPLMNKHGSAEVDAADSWDNLSASITALMGPDKHDLTFSESFSSYAAANYHSIKASFQVLRVILIKAGGFSSRVADQLSMLLAGYWAYKSESSITEAEAKALFNKYNWEDLIPNKKMENQVVLISKLKQYKVYLVNESSQKKYTRTIAALLDYVSHNSGPPHKDIDYFEKQYAISTLHDMGFRVEIERDGIYVAISNSSHTLSAILQGTQWANNWGHSLKSLPGAYVSKAPKWFGKSIGSQRCTMLPLGLFISEENKND